MTQKGKGKFRAVQIALLLLALIATASIATAPPTPHNVRGTIFTNGSTQVPVGVPVRINNTVLNVSTLTFTSGPPFSPGSYAASINGNNGDNITVTSWNATHYGINNSILMPTTTTIHVVLNITRSETNLSLNMSNNTVINITQTFNFTINVSVIGGQSGIDCSATINISTSLINLTPGESYTHSLGSIPVGQHVATSWNLTANASGTTNITANSSCSSDTINLDGLNRKTAYNITVTDPFAPVITQELPLNNSWLAARNITLSFNVTDDSGLANCSLYINGTLNQTAAYVQKSVSQNFTINSTPDGAYKWLVECFDDSTSRNRNISMNLTFYVDATGPNVTLFAPANDTALINNLVNFTYNATDQNNVTNCSLVINNAIEAINYSIEKNKVLNFTALFKRGKYEWYINCSDNITNTGQSEVRTVNITDPDLTITLPINFSTTEPVEGQVVMVNATIRNDGDENADNVVVSFYEDYGKGIQINGNSTASIAAFSEISFEHNWTAKIGLYNITVIVDPPLASNGSINESNETNNIANRTIFLQSYITYYGQAVLDIILGSQAGEFIRNWQNKTNSTGNIYVTGTQTKSAINWQSLQAIGIKTDTNRAINDWEEIDYLLNTTNMTDSINMTYTFSGEPRNVTSFTAFSAAIQNVSVVNSTNTSSFLTGILWDTSDSTDNEYDQGEAEDIVFVTTINRGKQGRYGTYDYEIKVPASLRKYRNSTSEFVQFYTEID